MCQLREIRARRGDVAVQPVEFKPAGSIVQEHAHGLIQSADQGDVHEAVPIHIPQHERQRGPVGRQRQFIRRLRAAQVNREESGTIGRAVGLDGKREIRLVVAIQIGNGAAELAPANAGGDTIPLDVRLPAEMPARARRSPTAQPASIRRRAHAGMMAAASTPPTRSPLQMSSQSDSSQDSNPTASAPIERYGDAAGGPAREFHQAKVSNFNEKTTTVLNIKR